MNSISNNDESNINSPRLNNIKLDTLSCDDNINLIDNDSTLRSPVLSFISDHSDVNKVNKIKHRFITLSPDISNSKRRSKSCTNEECFIDLKNNLSY